MSKNRQPSLYISHGGGPCFWVDLPPPFGRHAFARLRTYLSSLIKNLPQKPKALLVVSAHWETPVPTLGTCAKPPMIFDYVGFPEETYHLSFPAPGSPETALRAGALLEAAQIKVTTDNQRGFDHGVFVPCLIIDPDATIPVATLSLQDDLDPSFHIAVGTALAPLRDENILIIGSGSSYHNLRDFFNGEEKAAAEFDQWLDKAVTDPDSATRNSMLVDWEAAPQARACHPREEHLLPLMVAAGAGGGDRGRRVFSDIIGRKAISCFAFGESS